MELNSTISYIINTVIGLVMILLLWNFSNWVKSFFRKTTLPIKCEICFWNTGLSLSFSILFISNSFWIQLLILILMCSFYYKIPHYYITLLRMQIWSSESYQLWIRFPSTASSANPVGMLYTSTCIYKGNLAEPKFIMR